MGISIRESSSASGALRRPSTPEQALDPTQECECPPAPRKLKAKKQIHERLGAERVKGYRDEEGIILDDRANKLKKADLHKELPYPPSSSRRGNHSPPHNCMNHERAGALHTSLRPKLRRLLSAKGGRGGNETIGNQGGRFGSDGRREKAYLEGSIDGTLADYCPGLMPAIRETKRKDDTKKKGVPADETIAYLHGAIDQELSSWAPAPITTEAGKKRKRLPVVEVNGSHRF